MANFFKSTTKASIGLTPSTIYAVPSGVSHAVLLGLTLTNTSLTSTTASVQIQKGDPALDDIYLLKDIPIPSGTSFEVMSGQKIVLVKDVTQANGDSIVVSSSNATSVDVILSYLEST